MYFVLGFLFMVLKYMLKWQSIEIKKLDMGFFKFTYSNYSYYFFFLPELFLKLLLIPFVACGTLPLAILKQKNIYAYRLSQKDVANKDKTKYIYKI